MTKSRRLARCKKCNGEYEIIGVDDQKIDPDTEFNLHAVERRCMNYGWISNLVYHGGTLDSKQSQNKSSTLDTHLKERTESFERNLRDIAEEGRWRKYKT